MSLEAKPTRIAIVGPGVVGKSMLGRCAEENGFVTQDCSAMIREAAAGRWPLDTRDEYQGVFRQIQRFNGLDWIARKALDDNPANNLCLIGMRGWKDCWTWKKEGGLVVAVSRSVELILDTIVHDDPRYPKTAEEYEQHLDHDCGGDTLGSNLDYVIDHADITIANNGSKKELIAKFRGILVEVGAVALD